MKLYSLVALAFSVAAGSCFAFQRPELSDAEREHLESVLSGAQTSPGEMARALEKHLKAYPESPQRADLERAIIRSAIDANDEDRILHWGRVALDREIQQPLILERITPLLLKRGSRDNIELALRYAQEFEKVLRALEKEGPSSTANRGQMLSELDRALARSLVLQARALRALGRSEEALAAAEKAYSTYPNTAAAEDAAASLVALDRKEEAVVKLALAFNVGDRKSTDSDRERVRQRMGELYRELKGSEAGLGDLSLSAYDQTRKDVADWLERQRQHDPNSGEDDPMKYTLSKLGGGELDLSGLRGKVVVMDFWATWCGPCRVQHPLYEKVKERFAGRDDVVFLSVNTDEDPAAVPSFLERNKWEGPVYLEDGLSKLLRVSSIPTTIIMGREGKLFSRMNGFVPELFVDQLTDRIKEALGS
jgi:thiol-disulfide isomerase/thioredoxin